MRIAVDAMGGDYAPEEIIKGALLAHRQLQVEIALVGRPESLQPFLPQPLPSGITIVPAEEDVGMAEEPLMVRKKPKASINVSMQQVRAKQADAVVAAGNTGAAMAAAHLGLGRLAGIDRPAIGALLPTLKGKPVLLLDVGANVDCRPRFLEQFARMGSLYCQCVMGIDHPRVGLLNIGEEPNKGNDLAVATHQRLAELKGIRFTGNAEGRDVLTGEFDVVVCDGFVGNALLKFAESVGQVITQVLREELPRGWRGKIGTWLLKPNLKRVKRRMDYVEYGGALLLGVNGICVITHGSSKEAMVYHAIRLAKEAAEQKVLERLRTEMADNTDSNSNSRLRSRPVESSEVQSPDLNPEVLPFRPLDRVEG
ncbi:phosphate acyltransferase PlsX [Thermostichus vulcanus]|uniref:Phosphate acyltransferase n=1 Tax=Thermostichus vulcanus str. 'Rupite' TaxID=2813851 RepID=A0ABT0C9C0_THEVL|nr:phosphate acyltransferase PlsX [Thermostichus vulcanus str. 'Rupite']